MNLNLIPTVTVRILDEHTLLEGKNFYLTEGFADYVPKGVELFPRSGSLPVEFKMDESLRKEEYNLELTVWGATVKASSPSGAYYALDSCPERRKDLSASGGGSSLHASAGHFR